MKIGLIGLGKMGASLAENLVNQQIEVAAFDVDQKARKKVAALGVDVYDSLVEVINHLPTPKIVWVMLPAGEITQTTIEQLSQLLTKDDIIIEGGNSFYQDSVRRSQEASKQGIHFFDVGTSGGMSGAKNGGNFMIGGEAEIFPIIEPIFEKIAQPDGYLYTGKSGSGHYLKMVHNGIEYGMMQAIGEGFDLLQHSPYPYDNEKVAKVWNNGSVVRSWLMELAQAAFKEDPNLEELKGVMFSSGEGLWTVEEALKAKVPLPVITLALQMRYRSLEDDTFTGKVVASLRNGFGGHDVKK